MKKEEIFIEIRTGSDSDIPKIKGVYEVLDVLGISYEKRILSAHRTPMEMISEAQNLKKNGFKVSICAAGGSAHIAGMTASETVLPVVALPVKTSLGNGLDSLLSMLQMPPGIPNACVGIDAGKSAGILATRMAYFYDENIRKKLAKLENRKISDLEEILKNPVKKVNIVTQEFKNADFSLFEQMGIEYVFNEKINSYIPVLYVDNLEKISENLDLNKNIEYLTVLSPMEEGEGFDFSILVESIKNSVGNVGINRLGNGQLLIAQLLGNFFPEIVNNFQNYRNNLAEVVRKKDKKLRMRN